MWRCKECTDLFLAMEIKNLVSFFKEKIKNPVSWNALITFNAESRLFDEAFVEERRPI